ncbi:hypothetical protein [Microbacterium sp. 179-I 3D3 NHS]|uniref:hypothetical protein n=1 Tax=Microbacterium sp. 179-I 3D3 NHS TaxID=3142382 RepID=UPI0039A05A28
MPDLNETLVYVLTGALAVSAGIAMGVQTKALRWAGFSAAILITGVVVITGFTIGAAAPWMGPIFAVIAALTSVLIAAASRRDEPGFQGESYWRRVVLVLSPRYTKSAT